MLNISFQSESEAQAAGEGKGLVSHAGLTLISFVSLFGTICPTEETGKQ